MKKEKGDKLLFSQRISFSNVVFNIRKTHREDKYSSSSTWSYYIHIYTFLKWYQFDVIYSTPPSFLLDEFEEKKIKSRIAKVVYIFTVCGFILMYMSHLECPFSSIVVI